MAKGYKTFATRQRRRKIKQWVEDAVAVVCLFALGYAIILWGAIAEALVVQ
jgi:hypothetical protein